MSSSDPAPSIDHGPSDRAVEDLCTLAAQLCGTPIAAVSMVDQDRQRFTAGLGLRLSGMPTQDSFCAHAQGGRAPLVVPDALLDHRFASNPLVAGDPHLRFYAGAPLVTDGDVVLGTLCVMDTTPRTLTSLQLDQLALLARQVVTHLELRRQAEALADEPAAHAALRTSEARFRVLFENCPVGVAEALPDGTLVAVNPELCTVLGYTPDELVGAPASLLLADPSEAGSQQEDIARLRSDSPSFTERRYRRKDGVELSVLVGVAAVRDDTGEVVRLIGSVLDISERVAALGAAAAAQTELEARTAFIDAVLGSIDVGIVACDAQGTLTLFNDATKRWHGIDLEEALEDISHPERFAGAFSLHDPDGALLSPDRIPLLRALTEGSVRDVEMVISPRDLPSTQVLCNGRALSAPDGRTLGAVVAMTDVTTARAQTRALRSSESRFRATFDNHPAGLALLCPSGRALQVNPALCGMLARDADDLLSLPDLLTFLGPGGLQPQVPRECQVQAHDDELWVLVTVTELPDPLEGTCLLLHVEDITARKSSEQQLTRKALHDSLTGLPNRAMLLERTSTALSRLHHHPHDGVLAMLFCDLDGFKAVNDTYGHAAGDHLLREIALRLSDIMRPTDTVARLGGDEFVALCVNLPSAKEADRIAVRLKEAISRPVAWRGHVLRVTASVGISSGTPADSAADLVQRADTAMYRAKTRGKNRHEVFGGDAHPGGLLPVGSHDEVASAGVR